MPTITVEVDDDSSIDDLETALADTARSWASWHQKGMVDEVTKTVTGSVERLEKSMQDFHKSLESANKQSTQANSSAINGLVKQLGDQKHNMTVEVDSKALVTAIEKMMQTVIGEVTRTMTQIQKQMVATEHQEPRIDKVKVIRKRDGVTNLPLAEELEVIYED